MLKKLKVVDPARLEKAKELFEEFNEISSYRDEIIERAFKSLPDYLSDYGLREIKDNFAIILKLVIEESSLWQKEQEEMEFSYSYDGEEIPGELEDRMERESEGRYLTKLYKKDN